MVQALPQHDQTEVPTIEPTEVPAELPTEVPTELPTEVTEFPKGAMDKCNDVMANNGLNFSSFWHGAAHGIHSIGLEEIRHFFDPTAPEQNKIPVVNVNLSAEQTILFNSPLHGYDEDFKTMALKVMGFYMLHDQPDFFQTVGIFSSVVSINLPSIASVGTEYPGEADPSIPHARDIRCCCSNIQEAEGGSPKGLRALSLCQ